MNTRIDYLYRDAANFKVRNAEVVSGEMRKFDRDLIFACCVENGEYFIPSKIDLPENNMVSKGYAPDDDLDQPYFELQSIELTDEPPTLEMTAGQLAERFKLYANKNWLEWDAGEMKERLEKKEKIINKLDACMIKRLTGIGTAEGYAKLEAAQAIRDHLNIHSYLTTEHSFTDQEIDALLEFADPLEVALACWESNGSVDLDICDMLDQINAKSIFQLADGTTPEQYIPDGLPEMCWSVLPGEGKLICVKRGESGYYPSDWDTGDAKRNRETADFANEQRGITRAQELAMVHGSMYGWDTLGADPKLYERPEYAMLLERKEKPEIEGGTGIAAASQEKNSEPPEPDLEPDAIRIFWDDLTKSKQEEILSALGENGNFDVFPIAEIPVPPDAQSTRNPDHAEPDKQPKNKAIAKTKRNEAR